MWLFTNPDLSGNGILTNIHIENGKIIDTWNSELISTNFDDSNSFCIYLQESIDTVTVEKNQMITILDSENTFSEDHFTVKLVNDPNCYDHISAIIIQNEKLK